MTPNIQKEPSAIQRLHFLECFATAASSWISPSTADFGAEGRVSSTAKISRSSARYVAVFVIGQDRSLHAGLFGRREAGRFKSPQPAGIIVTGGTPQWKALIESTWGLGRAGTSPPLASRS